MLRSLLLATCVSFSLQALAADTVPPDSQVIRPLTANGFPRVVNLLNWNIQKGEQGKDFTAEIAEYVKGRNLITFQEGYEAPIVKEALAAVPGMSFTMAAAFAYKGIMTGVITGSVSEPARMSFRRSPDREPLLNSPKITALSFFRIDDQRELLVANLHGINFVGPDKFKRQIDDVADVLAAHPGPVILAGDFNTWNPARDTIVNDMARRLSLEEVTFPASKNKKAELDHVFVKGCRILKAWMPDAAKGSDHIPQFVDLSCGEN